MKKNIDVEFPEGIAEVTFIKSGGKGNIIGG